MVDFGEIDKEAAWMLITGNTQSSSPAVLTFSKYDNDIGHMEIYQNHDSRYTSVSKTMFNPSDCDSAAAVMYINGNTQIDNTIGLEYTTNDNQNTKVQSKCQTELISLSTLSIKE
ncbi:unnamed protein product [Adineta ricciae]|uniref:Uncharacterized protein n=1 Tax=Adineta ricciae TaxID=249248 RepID=A0A813Y2H1_ADIRI|nr:unnamed protein product [Adineta ricciae]